MRATQRFMREESGMAMALTVIMIALFSVMGAGLLIFATTDLGIVVEENRGQRAFEMADAGIAAAKQKLEDDSENLGAWKTGDGMEIEMDESVASVLIEPNTPSSGSYTVTSTGMYKEAKRKIVAVFVSTSTPGSSRLPQMVYAEGDIVGARVGIDGTPNGSGNPGGMSMYSKDSVEFKEPDVTLKDANIFSGGNITLFIQNSRNFTLNGSFQIQKNECSSSQNYFEVSGTDPYGNWDNSYNSTGRTTEVSGMAAEGRIKGNDSTNRKPCGWGTQFFDRDTDLFNGSNPKAEFVDTPSEPQPESQITYPFDKDLMDAPIEDTTVYQKMVDDLKAAAKAQPKSYTVPSGENTNDMTDNSVGNYIEIRNGRSKVNFCNASVACGTSDQTLNWPNVPAGTPASEWPVIYVKFMDNGNTNEVDWKVQNEPSFGSSSNPTARCNYARANSPSFVKRGILVVEDGNVIFSTGVGLLDGGVITRSTSATNRDIGKDTTPNTLCIRGPVIADGEIKVRNFAGFSALPTADYLQLPGFEGVSDTASSVTMSTWRESYED